MTDQVSGNQGMGPLSPQEKKAYELEYKKGADLFKRALDDYSHSKNMFQKEEFRSVMDKAMQVLNDAAAALQRKELLNQNTVIEKDFENFQSQDNQAAIDTLITDLGKAQKKVR